MEDEINLSNRIEWIDIAKCVGIIAIVLGHASSGAVQIICFSFNSVIFLCYQA